MVIDDYGDVYGVFVAVYGQDYSYAETKRYVDFLKRELLLVQDVAKIETFGERTEVIYVELQKERVSQLGIPVSHIGTVRLTDVVKKTTLHYKMYCLGETCSCK